MGYPCAELMLKIVISPTVCSHGSDGCAAVGCAELISTCAVRLTVYCRKPYGCAAVGCAELFVYCTYCTDAVRLTGCHRKSYGCAAVGYSSAELMCTREVNPTVCSFGPYGRAVVGCDEFMSTCAVRLTLCCRKLYGVQP